MSEQKIEFSEHPIYAELKEDWIINEDLTKGDHKTLVQDKYLWRHEFEQATEKVEGKPPNANVTAGAQILRATRQNRTRYTNRVKPVVRRMTAICFSNPINTSQIESLFEEGQIDDVDGEGTSLVDFIKKGADQYFRDGYLYGLVDSAPIAKKNKLEEQAAGLRPYMMLYPTLQVKDWDAETADPKRRGKYNWLRAEYELIMPRASALVPPETNLMCRVLTRIEGRYIIQIFVKTKSAWEHVRDIVPDPMVEEIPIASITDASWIRDVIPLALLRHNTQSSLDNGLMFQAHQRIMAAGNFKPGEGMVMNEGVVTLLPPDTNVTIVEPSNPAALKDRLSQIDAEIIQTAFLKDRIVPIDSRAVQGAEGQEAEETEFIAEMKRANKRLETWTNAMLKNWAAFQGKEMPAKIVFDSNIQKETVEQHMMYLRTMFDIMNRYPKWTKAELKKLVLARGLDDEKDIIAEIEAMKAEEPVSRMDVFKAALEKNGGAERRGKEDAPEANI